MTATLKKGDRVRLKRNASIIHPDDDDEVREYVKAMEGKEYTIKSTMGDSTRCSLVEDERAYSWFADEMIKV
jgi:hypothetical protein